MEDRCGLPIFDAKNAEHEVGWLTRVGGIVDEEMQSKMPNVGRACSSFWERNAEQELKWRTGVSGCC